MVFSDDMFVICRKTRAVFDHPFICARTNKRDEYRKTRVILNRLVVHVYKNKDTSNTRDFYI